MNIPFKHLTKKVTLGAVAALIAGTGATAAFAAIPHSTTGVISACRANADGAIRVIDAEASATCSGSETAMSWVSANDGDSSHSALARLEADSQDANNYVLNTTRSRNVVDVKTVNDPENEGYRVLCIKLTFNPEVLDITSTIQAGMSSTLALEMRSQGGSTGDAIDYYCGNDYHVFTALNPDSGIAVNQSISFTN